MKYCNHIFPLKREFANYRQLEQYLNLLLKELEIRKNREGFSFKYFYANSNRNYALKDSYGIHKETSTKTRATKTIPFYLSFVLSRIKGIGRKL